ncbi:MAG TPA: hypothetical protein VG188_01015 [Solirubrobacteraceae bacterium]|nr:hypothetical protein [Solirubrobacteraceae bacterium]
MTGKIVGATRSTDGRGGVLSTCIACGRYTAVGQSYCHEHRPKRRSAALRGGGAQIARFRREVLLLSGGRCEAVVDGKRCTETDSANLEAHHLIAVSNGGANVARENGVCLCKVHHAAIESRRLAI